MNPNWFLEIITVLVMDQAAKRRIQHNQYISGDGRIQPCLHRNCIYLNKN